ncbi:hypothetical protein [Aquimarina algiphila]|uniref:hypothetical protein n=1 Tax=Aquimarina algiphila TaxID=2047982 RepID=UPI00232B015D|nr:hypothetical protein [Aquimarina algiphila]
MKLIKIIDVKGVTHILNVNHIISINEFEGNNLTIFLSDGTNVYPNISLSELMSIITKV